MHTNKLALAVAAAQAILALPLEQTDGSAIMSLTPDADGIMTTASGRLVLREGPTLTPTWSQEMVPVSSASVSVASSADHTLATESVALPPREGPTFSRTWTPSLVPTSSSATTTTHSRSLHVVHVPRATGTTDSDNHISSTTESTLSDADEDDAADYDALVELGLVYDPSIRDTLNLTGTKLGASIDLARRNDNEEVDMNIDEHAKIGGRLTPLAKFMVKYADHLASQFCYDYFVNGRDPGTPDIHTQNCILVKHSAPLRKKAPHAGQFWYNFAMGKRCFNDLKRTPCIVDLQRDTGCGWDNINKFQKRCKHFPNAGITGPVDIDTRDLSWILPDHGDAGTKGKECEMENMDAYYNHGKKNKQCDGTFEKTKGRGGDPKKEGQM